MLKIFDVDHGFAALHSSASGINTMFDCGHSSITGFRPSQHLRATTFYPTLSRLIVSHADEDHVSDLPGLLRVARPGTFYRNRSIPNATLHQLKAQKGPIREGVSAYLSLDREYTLPLGPRLGEPAFYDLDVECFYNDYPRFADTNNLSLVSFASFGALGFVFPGDLERAGWLALLANPAFRAKLARVNVFVASHHGRASGYCPEVFDVCTPHLIIISDEPVQYESQVVPYSRHSIGVPFGDGSTRRVLSTRKDGHLTFTSIAPDRWHVQTSS